MVTLVRFPVAVAVVLPVVTEEKSLTAATLEPRQVITLAAAVVAQAVLEEPVQVELAGTAV